jgi:hypothetical protein
MGLQASLYPFFRKWNVGLVRPGAPYVVDQQSRFASNSFLQSPRQERPLQAPLLGEQEDVGGVLCDLPRVRLRRCRVPRKPSFEHVEQVTVQNLHESLK